MAIRIFLLVMLLSNAAFSQMPPIEPGVSRELARWRAAHYSDVRYKLNLALEKMSPVLKGTMEIRVNVHQLPRGAQFNGGKKVGEAGLEAIPPIVLDWRKIKGFEERSRISEISLNGRPTNLSPGFTSQYRYKEENEHLAFSDGVVAGENVIKLDFTSPILPSGSAITRYVDKEDGAEYIYSLFVPSDASTAFPVFDQPDLKARFDLSVYAPKEWRVVSNSTADTFVEHVNAIALGDQPFTGGTFYGTKFPETRPISTYVFALAAGPFEKFDHTGGNLSGSEGAPLLRNAAGQQDTLPTGRVSASVASGSIYVRKSQAAKFKPHAAEVFRLNREAVKYFEEYFDYRFPWPKYDLVLIPEFPFGGMEHAGATFLREASVIFPQEPTRNDHINRATLIFHEAAHQWFGDTVTMRWFDDLWLKEGFATFTAYKAMEKIMPEMNAWKVFYERVKQAAYQTDSTKGTTPIYQEIKNLSAAKSAYGNIVYNKAPAFLRQAEFYLGEDRFQTAVRSFLKKHEFGNAGWEDLVREFEAASGKDLKDFASKWVTRRGAPIVMGSRHIITQDKANVMYMSQQGLIDDVLRPQSINVLVQLTNGERVVKTSSFLGVKNTDDSRNVELSPQIKFEGPPVFFRDVSALIPNYGDYGYGIFLLDAKSRDYVLKNIQNEKDPFLRSMMWGALWDSVREGELDPREYVELVVKVLSSNFSRPPAGDKTPRGSRKPAEAGTQNTEDESTTALLLNRVGTALNYYIDESSAGGGKPPFRTASGVGDLGSRVEDMLITGMQNAPTQGQRITYYRAFLNVAASERARGVLKGMLKGGNPSGSAGVPLQRGVSGRQDTLPTGRVSASAANSIPLKTKDKFDIVTRLVILQDPEAPGLLAALEKTETSDEAKRYAYAARAGIATAENKARYWKDFTENKEISESWIEAAFGSWNSIRHSELTLPYLERALKELPNHKRNRKIFFVNGWLGAFIGGQRNEEALVIVNKFLADNPNLDPDLRLKILENVDIIERAVKIRRKHDRSV
jgi:aminopeptidase N